MNIKYIIHEYYKNNINNTTRKKIFHQKIYRIYQLLYEDNIKNE